MANFNPCCCLSVKTGAILIAVLEIVLSIIFAGFSAVSLAALAAIHTMQNGTVMQQVKDEVGRAHPEMTEEDPDAIFGMLYLVLGLSCVMCVLQIIFGSLLLHGIRQERLKLLKLWMVFKASCIIFNVIFIIAIAIMQSRSRTIGEISIDVVSVLLGQYFLYVVYRLYKEMWANSQNHQRPKPNNKAPAQSYEYYG